MATAQRSPHTPSVQTRTSKPSLLPAARRPSFSTPGPSSPNPTSSGFRALRSLLPFGPNKHPTPISPSVSASPNPNGSRFASFSSVRKSMNRDRNASLSVSGLPVMVIDQAHAAVDDSVDIPLRKSISLPPQPRSSPDPPSGPPTLNLPDASQELTAPSPDTSQSEQSQKLLESETTREELNPVSRVFRTPSPNPDLSTIIEADTSGISKHLPSASPSPSPSPTSLSPPSLPHDLSFTEDTSALDLSTTHLESQVLDAITAQESAAVKSKWLSRGNEPAPLASAAAAGNISFNFGALDPDLAALLSPHRIVSSDTDHTIRARSSAELSDSASAGLQPQHQSSRPRLRAIQRPSTPPTELVTRRSPSVSPSTTNYTQTTRRPPPSPLSLSHPPSPVASPNSLPSPLSNSSPVHSSTPAIRRTQHSASVSTSTPARRPMLGRMLQSDWEGTSSATRPSLDSAGYRPSTAPTSRASMDTNRQRPSIDAVRQTSAASTVLERPSAAESWSTKFRRTRKRSMSVDEQRMFPLGHASPYSESRPGSSMSSRPEWLGPRTAKAFKAAGLLPDSAEGNDSFSPSAVGTRSRFGFGSVRGTSSVRSDSRIGSVTSPTPRPGSSSGRRRGSGSGSYFGSAGSQLIESPTLTMSSRDTPRSVSTAPTSVSGASWDRDELRELKDKHAVETGALLSALSDSQRTTKVLREENAELREQLAKLEAEVDRMAIAERENQALREFVSELREEAGQLKLQLRLAAPISGPSRYVPAPPTQAFRLAARVGDENVSEDSFNVSAASSFNAPAASSVRNARRRLSSSSSNFGPPPSNMSLLLHEDGANLSDFDERSGASGSILASPTMILGRVDHSHSHRANQSIASVTSMATTSPNASIGSPRSLSLMPEHEVHLEDMDSLDLGRPGPDEEWSE